MICKTCGRETDAGIIAGDGHFYCHICRGKLVDRFYYILGCSILAAGFAVMIKVIFF
jgi:hypothetical protein